MIRKRLSDGIAGDWRLNNSFVDSSGRGNEGAAQGSITFETADPMQGSADAIFTGTGGSHIHVNDRPSINPRTGITIVTIINPDNVTDDDHCPFGKEDCYSLCNSTDASSDVVAEVHVDGAERTASGTNTLLIGRKNLFVMTYDSTTKQIKVFVNNVLKGITTLSGLSTYEIERADTPVTIGAVSHTTGEYKGDISRAILYNRALSDGNVTSVDDEASGELGELWDGGNIKDVTYLPQRQSYQIPASAIIDEAYRVVEAISPNDIPTTDQRADALRKMEFMVKALQTKKGHLFRVRWNTYDVVASDVVLGSDSVDHRCILTHDATADTAPVTGKDYATHWITLATSAGGAHAVLARYSAAGQIQLDPDVVEVKSAFLRKVDGTDTTLTPQPSESFFFKESKGAEGTPRKIFFRRYFNTVEVYITPQPDTATDILHVEELVQMPDIRFVGADTGFHPEWYESLVFGLALRLGLGLGVPTERLKLINELAGEALQWAALTDAEMGAVPFDSRTRRGAG